LVQPAVLAAAKASHSRMAAQICCDPQVRRKTRVELSHYLTDNLGFAPEPADLDAIQQATRRLADDLVCRRDLTEYLPKGVSKGEACYLPSRRQLSLMQQRKARVGFTTLGHTSVDIQVFAAGWGRYSFAGLHENHEIGRRLFEAVGLDAKVLDPITDALNDCKTPVLPP
jgi:alkaline phosphatase